MKKLILLSILLILGSLFISCGANIKVNPVEYYDKYGNQAGVDCEGVPNGKATIDMCGVCDDDATNDCTQDCIGEWGGKAFVDDCDNCVGGNTDLEPCSQE